LATSSQDIANYSNLNPFTAVLETDTMDKAMNKISGSNVHRAPVLSSDGKTLKSMLSQSAIVKWLWKNGEKLNSLKDKSLRDLHLGAFGTIKPVFTVDFDEPLMEAFSILHKNKVTGIGVVNEEGILIGSISVSDIKMGVGEHLEMLSFPVKNLFDTFHRRDMVTCKGSDPFLGILDKLANTGVHRVFVVDWEGKPTGVITHTDIIDIVLTTATSYDPSWK